MRLTTVAITILATVSVARADGAPAALNDPIATLQAEANYQISTLSNRILSCSVQIGQDNREIARLNGELTSARAEIAKLKPTPTPTSDAKPPESPK